MNRNLRESFLSSRNVPALSQHRRGNSLTGSVHRDSEENLDLFSKNRRSLSVASSDDSSDVSVKLGKLSVGSAKVSKTGLDDLLSAADGGKHDYDWLLTPPGTPLFPSPEGTESKPTSLAPKSSSRGRSISTTKASRLSVSQTESNHSARPARSSSVTRSSVSTSYSTLSSKHGPSILNTSSASVSSYIRPSSPSGRLPSTARSSTPSTRQTLSRPSTPSRVRPATSSSSVDKPRPSQTSRPSTPSSRPQVPANLTSTAARSSSRPSTPTRRSSIPSTSSTSTRVLSNGHSSAPTSRPSSPSPRPRPPQQPVIPPDFPMDTPPNLRTTLPSDRPVSAGRSRPGVAVTAKSSQDTAAPVNVSRRHSSPTVTRGRLVEPPARSRSYSNGHAPDMHEPRRTSNISESATWKPLRSSSTNLDSTGFGRTISKKSLDMAIRHMDIRNGTGGVRPISGTALFPQSIRSASAKSQSVRGLSPYESPSTNGSLQNGDTRENGHAISKHFENGSDPSDVPYSAKLSAVDFYESSRYDALLLKEDLKNTNWLHSIDDKSEQGSIFDNGFEVLPEPFGLL